MFWWCERKSGNESNDTIVRTRCEHVIEAKFLKRSLKCQCRHAASKRRASAVRTNFTSRTCDNPISMSVSASFDIY